MKKRFILIGFFFFLGIILINNLSGAEKYFIIDDFEDNDYISFIDGNWITESDSLYCKGTSSGEISLVKGAGASKKAIKLAYTLGKMWGSSPFINMVSKFKKNKNLYDGFTGIRFYIKGKCKKLRFVLPSANITDYNYWGYIIDNISSEWKEVVITWQDLKPGWNTTKDLKESLQKVTEIQFHQEEGRPQDKGWIAVDNISLIRDPKTEESFLERENRLVQEALLKPVIDVNQAFYAKKGIKQALVRSSLKLKKIKYSIHNKNNKKIKTGSPKYWGKLWKQHFWLIDFTSIKKEGEYTIVVFYNKKSIKEKIIIDDEKLQKAVGKTLFYFYTQRCGQEIPKWHKVCHLDDGVLPNGEHIDASGGWHDCAGFDKELYTTFLPVYFYTTIAFDSNLEWKQKMLDEAKWGADWIMKMTDKRGNIWTHVQPHDLPPDKFIKVWADGVSTDNKLGTADDRKITTNAWGPEESAQACSMGALAKLGYLIKEQDKEYSKKCIEKAKLVWNYLKNKPFYFRGKLLGKGKSHYNIFNSGMLLADIYLYKVEKDKKYLFDAKTRINFLIDKCQHKNGEYLSSSREKIPQSGKSFDPYFHIYCFYEYYKNFPKHSLNKKIKKSIKWFMKNVSKRLKHSPYGQAQLWDSDLKDWVAINMFKRSFEKPRGDISQGKNCYWLSLAGVCFIANEMLKTDKYTSIAVKQIDWVLGKNPFGVSTVADIGTRFPRMFTMFYWLDNHPASEGVIPGGVINGIGGDKNDAPFMDMNNNNWMKWETNEYWNPPTAWFAIACWKYYKWLKRN